MRTLLSQIKQKVKAMTGDIPKSERMMKSFLSHLKQTGYTPESVLDIGAYKGRWTTTCKKVFPNALLKKYTRFV